MGTGSLLWLVASMGNGEGKVGDEEENLDSPGEGERRSERVGH